MNNMENKKNMYGGNNFIFESMANSVLEDKAKGKDKKSENLDSDTLIASILNTSFSILLNSKMENAKTVRGFQEVKNKMLGSNNFGVFRQYLISLLQSLAGMDLAQRDAYQKNIDFVNELFGKLQPLISDDKVFNTTKVGLITKLVNNFEDDLKKRETQLRKTDPKIYADALKKGLVLKEDRRSGEDTDVEEAEFRSTAFNKSKESLDAATAFVGIISRDKYVATLKNNADLAKYETIANDLYKKAQDLQLTDRAGIAKVVTPTGTFKAGEYKRQQDNLINEIIRQKKEYERVKNAALKASSNLDLISVTAPDPVCPVGMVYDKTKAMCVSAAPVKDETATTVPKKKKTVVPVPVKSCVFPIKVGGAKCTQVGELQNKILELIPSAKAFLTTKGGSDKIYGKSTALVTNIIWGYISNNKNIGTDSDLTQEKYDAIMKLTTNDIDLDLSSVTPVRDNLNSYYKTKIEESEIVLDIPILSFDTFFDIINETSLPADSSKGITGGYKPPVDPALSKKILKDSCIKKSIESGKIEDCFGTKPVDPVKDDEKKKEEEKKDKPWEGLKPPKNGIYAIGYDSSLMDFWGKVAIGTAAGVAVLATGGAALAAFAPAGLAAAVGGTAFTSAAVFTAGAGASTGLIALSGAGLALTVPVAVGAGIVTGGTAGAYLSDRSTLAVTINSGFISRSAITKIVRGLINTIDGYTSGDDWQAVMATLCLLKGTWTCNADETKAVSTWGEVKRLYLKKEKTALPKDISTTDVKVGDVEYFPDFSSRDFSEGMDTDWQDAYDEVIDAIRRLDANESKMIKNLDGITEEIISAVIDGSYMVKTSSLPKKKKAEVKTEVKTIDSPKEEDKGTGFNL